MNLYLVERTDGVGYDDYDSMVVACNTEDEARSISPCDDWTSAWVEKDKLDTLKVTLIGIAAKDVKRGIVIDSFNAG